jgi:hypothetical protein
MWQQRTLKKKSRACLRMLACRASTIDSNSSADKFSSVSCTDALLAFLHMQACKRTCTRANNYTQPRTHARVHARAHIYASTRPLPSVLHPLLAPSALCPPSASRALCQLNSRVRSGLTRHHRERMPFATSMKMAMMEKMFASRPRVLRCVPRLPCHQILALVPLLESDLSWVVSFHRWTSIPTPQLHDCQVILMSHRHACTINGCLWLVHLRSPQRHRRLFFQHSR